MSRARKTVRVGTNWKMVCVVNEVKRFDDIKAGDYFWDGYELYQRVVDEDRPEARLAVRVEDGDLQTYDFSPYVKTVTLELRRIQEARAPEFIRLVEIKKDMELVTHDSRYV